jgi:hypothetical protein
MHKFKTNDQNKKVNQLKSWQLSLAGWNRKKLKVWRQLKVQLKAIWRIVAQLKFINLKSKTLNKASFRFNEKKRWVTCCSIDVASVLTALADRVGNFKYMNVELQTFKLSKIWFKWKVCFLSNNFRWS